MKFIAHRGLFNGPDVNLENRPEQIELAISLGFECEVDLWMVDNKLFLGHDRPDYEISKDWLRKKPLWIHAKNLAALDFCSYDIKLNYFWHENDSYTLTSLGYIWTYAGKPLPQVGIMLMPEWYDPEFKNIDQSCFGICSDYVAKIQQILSNK